MDWERQRMLQSIAVMMQRTADRESPALRELHHKVAKASRIQAFLHRQLVRQERILSNAHHDIHYLPCNTQGWTDFEFRVHLNVVHGHMTYGGNREQLERAHSKMHQYTEPKMPLLS